MSRPHAYGCRCRRCRAMAAAIGAVDETGEYFFSDAELFKLATEDEDEDDPDPDIEYLDEDEEENREPCTN